MSVIDDYLANIQPAQKVALEHVRFVIKQTVPDAEETIGYGMPAFKYKNKPLMYFAAFTNHMSIFPTAGPAEALKDKLAGFTTSKGTVQFTLEKPLPDELITELLRLRTATIDDSSKS